MWERGLCSQGREELSLSSPVDSYIPSFNRSNKTNSRWLVTWGILTLGLHLIFLFPLAIVVFFCSVLHAALPDICRLHYIFHSIGVECFIFFFFFSGSGLCYFSASKIPYFWTFALLLVTLYTWVGSVRCKLNGRSLCNAGSNATKIHKWLSGEVWREGNRMEV